jgi:hypothetical protein
VCLGEALDKVAIGDRVVVEYDQRPGRGCCRADVDAGRVALCLAALDDFQVGWKRDRIGPCHDHDQGLGLESLTSQSFDTLTQQGPTIPGDHDD